MIVYTAFTFSAAGINAFDFREFLATVTLARAAIARDADTSIAIRYENSQRDRANLHRYYAAKFELERVS